MRTKWYMVKSSARRPIPVPNFALFLGVTVTLVCGLSSNGKLADKEVILPRQIGAIIAFIIPSLYSVSVMTLCLVYDAI